MTKSHKFEDIEAEAATIDGARSPATLEIARGTIRHLADMGSASLMEFPLPNGQRADIAALTRDGRLIIVEVKSCLEDFRADRKWAGYRDYCDELYFAVLPAFPAEVLPGDAGLILADRFGAECVRAAPSAPLAAARRKALTLRFARTAALRLSLVLDPGLRTALANSPA